MSVENKKSMSPGIEKEYKKARINDAIASKAIERTKFNDRPKSLKSSQTIIIHWDLLEIFIKAGYNGKQIAEKFGISYSTLQKRCLKENNVQISHYIKDSPERIIEQFDQPENVGSKFTTWDRIDKMLEAGCLGVEIASSLGMNKEYFYKLMKIKYKENFSDTRRQKKLKGDAQLRVHQFNLAMKGDRKMLVLLGKERLSQVDTHEVNMNVKARVLTPDEINEHIRRLEEF